MVYPIKSDVMAMLQHLVEAIKPFARSNFVNLVYKSEIDALEITYHPEFLMPDLTQILCRIITFTPSNYEVSLSAHLLDTSDEKTLQIKIVNTGVNLDHFPEIISGIRYRVNVISLGDKGTVFELRLGIEPESKTEQEEKFAPTFKSEYKVPVFYKKLRKHMQIYATNIKSIEEAVAKKHSMRQQVFLKKVNAIILSQLDREDFDVSSLSRALAISRTQLYRRLKPLVQLAPSQYIRFIRLQKAREYLENGEMTVGEVSFKVGFVDKSHFARAFNKQFGFIPSLIRKNKKILSHE